MEALLQRCGLPTNAPEGMTSDEFLSLMGRDKKVIDGQLRLVLLRRMGEALVTADVPLEDVRAVL